MPIENSKKELLQQSTKHVFSQNFSLACKKVRYARVTFEGCLCIHVFLRDNPFFCLSRFHVFLVFSEFLQNSNEEKNELVKSKGKGKDEKRASSCDGDVGASRKSAGQNQGRDSEEIFLH